MQNIDIKNFTTVSSVEPFDHVVVSLFGGASAKISVALLRSVLVRGITPSISKDGVWIIGDESTEVQAEGQTPVLRRGASGIEWKYTHEDESLWRMLISFDEIKFSYDDLTPEQKNSLKLTFADLTPEDIAQLQQPAAEMIEVLRQTDTGIKEAESVRVAGELARQENETLRSEAELQRADAELKRAEAETLRSESETERQAAETSRTTAESKRQSAESARSNAESQRVRSESARIESESSRSSSENTRIRQESERVLAEQKRSSAEIIRREDESARVTAEQSRVDAEQQRSQSFASISQQTTQALQQTSEAARAANDAAGRVDNAILDLSEEKSAIATVAEQETLRVAAEAERRTAEQKRISNEESRIGNETDRQEAEQNRQQQEQQRTSNETSRVSAEQSRATDYAQLRTDMQLATTHANQAADKARNLPAIHNGTWWLYDADKDTYVDSGVSVNNDFTLTKEAVEGVLTGNIQTHYHDQYVEKEEGKGLSEANFTQTEKEKLDGLKNYDDTSLTERVQGLEDNMPSKVSDLENDKQFVTASELEGKDYATHTELNEGLDGKVGKVEGMGLSETSFTQIEKDYLATLHNYDDTALKNQVKEVADAIPTKVSQVENDSQYITSTELTNKKYATEASLNEGIQSLQKEVATKQAKNVYYTNLTATAWIKEDVYEDYPYRCDLACEGVTENDYAEVVFSMEQHLSGDYAPICETKDGIVSIWSAKDAGVVVPTVIIYRG